MTQGFKLEQSRLEQYHIARKVDSFTLLASLMSWYNNKCGYSFDIESPRTFNEKIQWMKVFGRMEQYTKMTDKILVREYVKDKVGDKYLIRLLGIWNNFADIPFSKLPDIFMLKCNHGCEMNMIIKDYPYIDISTVEKIFTEWYSINYAFYNGFEFQYKNIVPCFFAEEYLENCQGTLCDYKLWCFDGKPYYILYICNRHGNMQQYLFDTSWNLQNFSMSGQGKTGVNIPKPNNLEEMIEVAATLSYGIPFVRIDLYRLNNGDIKFGEMTFSPASGTYNWNPQSWDNKLGDLFVLPNRL